MAKPVDPDTVQVQFRLRYEDWLVMCERTGQRPVSEYIREQLGFGSRILPEKRGRPKLSSRR